MSTRTVERSARWVLWALLLLGVVQRAYVVGAFGFQYIGIDDALIQQVALETGVPVAFGVLTTDTMEQAMARAGGDVGNKGREALVTVLETLHQIRRAAGG